MLPVNLIEKLAGAGELTVTFSGLTTIVGLAQSTTVRVAASLVVADKPQEMESVIMQRYLYPLTAELVTDIDNLLVVQFPYNGIWPALLIVVQELPPLLLTCQL
jgi:hypothetical protein